MKRLSITLIAALVASVSFAQFTNVIVGSGSEVSIIIDPNTPANLVAGANITAYFWSSDTGQTWQQGNMTSSHGVNGDPVILVDEYGDFYYFHLVSSLEKVVCQKSTDGGATWSDGSLPAYITTTDQDKEWAVYDPVTDNIHCAWSSLDAYSSSNPLDSARIYLSTSTDLGTTWSPPVRVSKTAGNCGWDAIKGSVPAMGPNGEIYVTWTGNGIDFQKSTDGGLTWLPQDIKVDTTPDWYYAVPNFGWGNSFTGLATDLSPSIYNGNIYVSWSDTRNGATDGDVFVANSSDGGNTWTTVRVNDDFSGSHNWHPWVCVDQVTGAVYCAFYDRRNYTNDVGTDMYLAHSIDGGQTWINNKISTATFSGAQWDYNGCTAHNGIIRPIWSQDGTVYTALIDHASLTVGYDEKTLPTHVQLQQVYPNPVMRDANVKFSVNSTQELTLQVHNTLGELVTTVFSGKVYNEGFYEYRLDAQKHNLSAGLYVATLSTANGNNSSLRFVVE